MTNEISMLIQNIDDAETASCISVMESLVKCYQKEILIQENCSCDISEFSIYQEADDNSDEKDTSKSKQMWDKFVSYIKLLINKLKNFFTKLNSKKIKEKYDKLENKNIVIPAGEDARLLYYLDDCLETIGIGDFTESEENIVSEEDVEKILNIDTSKLPILQDYPSDKDYVLSEDICNAIIEDINNLIVKKVDDEYNAKHFARGCIVKVGVIRRFMIFLANHADSIEHRLSKNDRSKYMKNVTKICEISFNEILTTWRIFNKYVNKEYKKQSAKNGKPEPTGESFYVDDEFDEFDFYDEGFKDKTKDFVKRQIKKLKNLINMIINLFTKIDFKKLRKRIEDLPDDFSTDTSNKFEQYFNDFTQVYDAIEEVDLKIQIYGGGIELKLNPIAYFEKLMKKHQKISSNKTVLSKQKLIDMMSKLEEYEKLIKSKTIFIGILTTTVEKSHLSPDDEIDTSVVMLYEMLLTTMYNNGTTLYREIMKILKNTVQKPDSKDKKHG